MSNAVKKIINWGLRLFYPIFKKWMPYQVYAYLAVGAANTLLNIALFALVYALIPVKEIPFFSWTLASYTIALLLAFVLTVPTGFWLSKHFAFTASGDDPTENKKQLGRYFLVVTQGLISDWLLLKALIIFTMMHPTLAKVISTVVIVTINYLLQKYYTFRMKEKTIV